MRTSEAKAVEICDNLEEVYVKGVARGGHHLL